MQQLEISFFYPLTEQISLDLDFTPSEQWKEEWKKKQGITYPYTGSLLVSNGGTGAISGTLWSRPPLSTFVVKSNEKTVGKWQITDGMFVYRSTKPNAVIRFMAKHLLGFKWHDEN